MGWWAGFAAQRLGVAVDALQSQPVAHTALAAAVAYEQRLANERGDLPEMLRV